MNTVQGFHFDTVCEISAEADVATVQAALDQCPRYEQLLSRFIEGSDVWRINHAEGTPVDVSPETLEVLACAADVLTASGGAFNIAVGAASKLWQFTGEDTRVPSDDELDQALAKLRGFSLAIKGSAVSIPAGVTIDLGGIAKGYICDKVADYLREQRVTCAMLNFGGNVVTIGQHPKGRPWQVGLQQPGVERGKALFAAVQCTDAAVVTSGVYERGFMYEGQLYHHILDPRTCKPATSDVVSATIVSPDAMLADALATAVLVLGSEEGMQLAARYNVDAALLTVSGELSYTQGMPLVVLSS